MTLDEVRELKEELKKDLEFKQAELADLEDKEVELETAGSAEMDEYFQRLTGLLNAVETGRDFRISFRKDGEANRTNLLPPGKDDKTLRAIAFSMIVERGRRYAAREGCPAVMLVETFKKVE